MNAFDPRPGNRARLLLVLAFVLAFFAPAAHASTRWATLEAIHVIENPHNVTSPGAHGELGAYQFREPTWRMHTASPFSQSLERSSSDEVAVRHYEWLKRGLERGGVAITPYNIALAWNAGLDAVLHGRAPRASHDYANRVAGLARDFAARR